MASSCAAEIMSGRSGSCNAVAVARLVHGDFPGCAEAANTLLSMSPAFEHDMQPASSKKPSSSHTNPWKGSVKCTESRLSDEEVKHVSHKGTEPAQDASCSQQGSQVAGSQDVSALLPDSAKAASGNSKKKKNRKKGLKGTPAAEQVTARGIMEGSPAPEGPPVVEDSLPLPKASVVEDPPPSPSHADAKGDAFIPAGATAAISVIDQGDSLGSAEQGSQQERAADVPPEEEPYGAPESAYEPESVECVSAAELDIFSGHGFSTTDVELLNNLHITAPAESEEEVFHDAGSGFESSAQHTGTSSRRVSTDSELIWPLYNGAGKSADPGYVRCRAPKMSQFWGTLPVMQCS